MRTIRRRDRRIADPAAYGQRNMGVATQPTQPQKSAQEKAAEEAQRKLDEKPTRIRSPGFPSATKRTRGESASLTGHRSDQRTHMARYGTSATAEPPYPR